MNEMSRLVVVKPLVAPPGFELPAMFALCRGALLLPLFIWFSRDVADIVDLNMI